MEHCYSVQRFILLGQVRFEFASLNYTACLLTHSFQGDFARILMEMLGEELSKPAHAAMRHNITGIVEAALRTSASAGEDTFYDHAHSCYWESLISFGRYRDRVHVALMEESSQDQVMQLLRLQPETKVSNAYSGLGCIRVGVSCRRTFSCDS